MYALRSDCRLLTARAFLGLRGDQYAATYLSVIRVTDQWCYYARPFKLYGFPFKAHGNRLFPAAHLYLQLIASQ